MAFGLALLLFDVLQRVARLFGSRPHEIVVAGLHLSLLTCLRICGTRIEVVRSTRVRPWEPYILVANHQSMFDVPLLGAVLPTNFPKYVSKRELARFIPSVSYNLRRGGNAIIDRGNRSQALAAITELGRLAAARGVSVVIYPEGTRARKGEMGTFKPAGTLALMAAAPSLPVVPVAIDGSWRLLKHKMFPVPFGTRVRVWVGDPIERQVGEDRDALLERVEMGIRGRILTWRDGAEST